MALRKAKLNENETDYVNAHATSTVQGDLAEAAALRNFFKAAPQVPVSSLKGHLGHTLGASGAIELIASLRMMEHSTVIHNLNLENIGEGCEGGNFVKDQPQPADLNMILKNSFAFGGINASLLCKKYQ